MRKQQALPADILPRLKSLSDILAAHDVVIFSYLFGGLVNGQVRPLSDVDIAVYLSTTEHLAEVKLELIGLISDHLGSDEFDLVILNSAPISLVGRILRQRRIMVDKDPPVRHEFESVMNRKFFDFSRKEENILRQRFG